MAQTGIIPDLTLATPNRRPSRDPRSNSPHLRPFTPWASIAATYADHLEVQRFLRFPEAERAEIWRRRRAHAPCDLEIPREWDLDALYFRSPDEQGYCAELKAMIPHEVASLSTNLVCLARPWVPHRWASHPVPATYRNFPSSGDLPNVVGEPFAYDSAWRLRLTSLTWGTGDPGRMVSEIRKEHRDSTRKCAELIAYQQVEYYKQNGFARRELYPRHPDWWDDVWVSQNMLVPLPPVLTYRARFLLEEHTPEGKFWWQVFEAEWTVLVFARWCTDIAQRSLMWALPRRIRENIDTMKVDRLMRGSRYKIATVKAWLHDHDRYDWTAKQQRYRIRGPTACQPELAEELTEFVRIYSPNSGAAAAQAESTFHLIPPGPSIPIPTIDLNAAPDGEGHLSEEDEEILASGVVGTGWSDPSGGCRQVVTERPESPHSPQLEDRIRVTADAPDLVTNSWTPHVPRFRSVPQERILPEVNPPTGMLGYGGGTMAIVDPLPYSLIQKIREAGLESCVQFHARMALHPDGANSATAVPLTERDLVFCVSKLEKWRLESIAELRELQYMVAAEKQKVESLTRRARRAEVQVDALSDALDSYRAGPDPKRTRLG